MNKERIEDKIIDIYDESHENYGAPKITQKLREIGKKISEKTVGNYMRELGIKAQYIKPYTVTTKDSNFSVKLKNILDEKFSPEAPDTVWCTDITYIWTYEGFVYLTSIMDLYSRKIISWVLSTTLESKWVVQAINKAKIKRGITNPLIIHSDRGIQYTCDAYRAATDDMIRSYSKKAYPWDNAEFDKQADTYEKNKQTDVIAGFFDKFMENPQKPMDMFKQMQNLKDMFSNK